MPKILISGSGKKAPPIKKIKKSKKKCHVCKHHGETSNIEEGCIIEILTINNENHGSLKPHMNVQVYGIKEGRWGLTTFLLVGGYWLGSNECTWRKVCSGCGKPIKVQELFN